MKKVKLALGASLLATTLSLSAAPANALIPYCYTHSCATIHAGAAYWIMACPAGVVASAMAKNWRRHQELTALEAGTCGLAYFWNEMAGKYGR